MRFKLTLIQVTFLSIIYDLSYVKRVNLLPYFRISGYNNALFRLVNLSM